MLRFNAPLLIGAAFVAASLLATPSFADNGGGNAKEIPLYHKGKAKAGSPETSTNSVVVPADALTEDSNQNADAGGGNAREIPLITGSTRVAPTESELADDSDINAEAGGGNAAELPLANGSPIIGCEGEPAACK